MLYDECMDVGPCLLVWLIGFITGLGIGKILYRFFRTQCLDILNQAQAARQDAEANLDKISKLSDQIKARHDAMLKMYEAIQKFQQAIGQTRPPDWDQEKKKLPDQL